MNQIVSSFVFLFGAVIALICAIYVALGMRKKKMEKLNEIEQEVN